MLELRQACALVAERATHVEVLADAIPAYAAGLTLARPGVDGPEVMPPPGTREERAAFWLTLDAINFGSGWFPTLRKSDGRSGFRTIEAGLKRRYDRQGAWTASELTGLTAADIAAVLGQDPDHELMGRFAGALSELGARVEREHEGSFAAVADSAGGSAVELARHLGGWYCFADSSRYGELELPFLKRAQITAADLHRAKVARFADLDRLTMFADNLVPHVLRLDGILRFEPSLVERIERGELIEHGSPEEVEIRACALHAVELIVAARSETSAADVDQILWQRGADATYKASPRHRSRCTAY